MKGNLRVMLEHLTIDLRDHLLAPFLNVSGEKDTVLIIKLHIRGQDEDPMLALPVLFFPLVWGSISHAKVEKKRGDRSFQGGT